MNKDRKEALILVADDDPEDCQFITEALLEVREGGSLRFVEDGERLLDYLRRRGEFADPVRCPQPSIVLLDLNMLRKDGREALREIKSDPALRRIPVVVLTKPRRRRRTSCAATTWGPTPTSPSRSPSTRWPSC